MNDIQVEHVSMFVKVKTFLSKKASELAATPVIAATIQPALIAQIDSILEEDEDASATVSGDTELKRELRKAVEEKGFEIAAACVGYYTITLPDPRKRARCNYERSQMGRMRGADLYVKMKQVFEIADPVKALLADYGVASADVTALNTALGEFFIELEGPHDAIGERSASGKQVDRLITEGFELLEEKLDVVMKFYTGNNPELYDYYLRARSIDQTGGGPLPDEDQEITIASGEFSGGAYPTEISTGTRMVIINSAANGSKVRLGFSNAVNSFTGTYKEVLPGNTGDFTAPELGYAPGILYFTLQNPGEPEAITITVRMKGYY